MALFELRGIKIRCRSSAGASELAALKLITLVLTGPSRTQMNIGTLPAGMYTACGTDLHGRMLHDQMVVIER